MLLKCPVCGRLLHNIRLGWIYCDSCDFQCRSTDANLR